MTPLTRSGAGRLVTAHDLSGQEPRPFLEEVLEESRFAVVRGALASANEAVELLRAFGPINEAETRKDGAVLVEDHADDEVFRSNAPLPLHKDGILTGFDVRLVGIFCADYVDVTGGRTYVSDATAALERIPAEHLELLRANGVEGMAVDGTGYYRSEYEAVWHRFPAFRAWPGREPTLALGLPHAPGERESWRVRVADVDEETNAAVLRSLREALLHDDVTYYHDWKEGDLLLMDNYAVLHGREGFEGRRRRLANIQVLAREPGKG